MPSIMENRIDPGYVPQNKASDQGLHCLHRMKKRIKIELYKAKMKYIYGSYFMPKTFRVGR